MENNQPENKLSSRNVVGDKMATFNEADLKEVEKITATTEHAENAFRLFERILKAFGLDLVKDKIKVLEIGSGQGVFLNYAKEKGVDIVGVDVSLDKMNGVSQVLSRVEHLPFAEGNFGVVLSTMTFDSELYSNQDQDQMLEEVCRVLKHKGVYIGREVANLPRVQGLMKISSNVAAIYQKL